MNFRISSTLKDLAKAKPVIEHAKGEDLKAKPSGKLIGKARRTARSLATDLGGKEIHVEISGHETTTGRRGFRPGHLSISVSRLDPKRQG